MLIDREALNSLLATLDLRASPNNRETVKAPDLRSLGQKLYRSLFRNGVADLFRTRREALADDERSGLRLRPELAPEDKGLFVPVDRTLDALG